VQADETQEKVPGNDIRIRYRHAIMIVTAFDFVNPFLTKGGMAYERWAPSGQSWSGPSATGNPVSP